MKGKSKESLRFVIDLKEMKSKTYVATVLGFKVKVLIFVFGGGGGGSCLLYTSPSPRDGLLSRMPSSA